MSAALCLALLAGSDSSAFGAPPPVEAFGDLPAIERVHLSPDGTHFSAIEPVNGRPAVLVFEVHPKPGTPPLIYSLPDSIAYDSVWVNNDRLVCDYYENKYNSERSAGMILRQLSRSVSVSISGKKPQMLMRGTEMYIENASTGDIEARSADDPNIVYMPALKVYGYGDPDTRLSNAGYRLNLYAVNVDTNKVDLVENGSFYTGQWVVDQHGHPVARVDVTSDQQTPPSKDTFLIKDGGNWREAGAHDNFSGSVANIDGITLDGAALAVDRYDDHGRVFLETLPLKAGEAPKVLFSDPQYDVRRVLHDEWTGRVTGVTYADDRLQDRYFDENLAHLQKILDGALPGQSVHIASKDATGTVYLVTADNPKNPPGVYLYTPAKGTLEYLMSAYPALQASDLSDVKPYPYKARDGLDIHAYLTLPTGRDPHKLPTVILPHGGPDDRDYIGFDWIAQFLASRGYAVLQPNFRGSTGYGIDFRNAGYGEWGRKMQDDVSDGVKKLIADGIADPKKICIFGGSFGGYVALAGATFTPDLYACAISYAGISDVPGILGKASKEGGSDSSLVHFWENRLGNRYKDVASQQAISPALHAENVRAPILLLHSNQDITVPVTQSEREQTALQAAGKQVDFVKIMGDDHYMSHSEARISVLKQVEAFLATHIGH
jgi:dienelactone hydrolase